MVDTLDPDVWKTAVDENLTERRAALQRLENQLAAEQNRHQCTMVDVVTTNPAVVGSYDPKQPEYIKINQACISADSPYQAVFAVAHEGRHAYQAHCIAYPAQHPEVASQTLQEWKLNSQNYIKPNSSNHEEYISQPLEKDAFAYARKVLAERYHGKEREYEEMLKQPAGTSIEKVSKSPDHDRRAQPTRVDTATRTDTSAKPKQDDRGKSQPARTDTAQKKAPPKAKQQDDKARLEKAKALLEQQAASRSKDGRGR
jgi:hypothetical protein